MKEDTVKFLIKRIFDATTIDELDKTTIKNTHTMKDYNNAIRNKNRNKSNDSKARFINSISSNSEIHDANSMHKNERQNSRVYSYISYEKKDINTVNKNNNENQRKINK